MKKNKKQLSIIKRIGLIAIALFSALGSLLLPFASKKQNNFASANDSTEIGYQFNGSDILFLNTAIVWQNVDYRTASFDISIINTLSDGWSIDFGCSVWRNTTGTPTIMSCYPYDDLTSTSSRWFTRNNFNDGYYVKICEDDTLNFYIPCFIKTDASFSANVKSVNITISSSADFPSDYTFSRDGLDCINIRYIDFNNNALLIQLLSPTAFSSYYDNRTYYFNDNFSDNEIFDNGYTEGFNAGLAVNQQPVYDRGFNAGYNAGEAFGYDKGVLEANDYSFKSLFGAVIDAPIKAFSGMFNFNFLGVNLLDFFFGLLTFGVIVFVIKLLLGGK